MTEPIYFDYMATTPIDDRVIASMLSYMGRKSSFGNPASTTHDYGMNALKAVDLARAQVASAINAKASEIIWTSGATESDNLALKGACQFYRRKGRHIITLKTEHKAVLDTCVELERAGFEVTYLTPEPNGLLSLDTLKQALRADTILVSIMHVNNEIGVIQDIGAIGKCLKDHGGILFHVDAAQSVGKLFIDVDAMHIDLLSISAHKIYGPKGIGALYVRSKPRVRLEAMIHGGGHENGLRSGTLPTHQIVGFGHAITIAMAEGDREQQRIKQLRERLWEGIKDIKGIHLNGDKEQRLAGNLNISFAGIDGEALLLALYPLAVSTTSACASASIEPSYVLKALGVSDFLAHSAIRLSIGRYTQLTDIDVAIVHINKALQRLQALAP